MSRTVVFVDFDGVLHPDRVYISNRGRPILRGDGQLFMWSQHLVDVLDDHQDVRIVLSTSWARMKSYSYARRQLPQSIRDRVFAATWHSAMNNEQAGRTIWDMSTRYQQIARFAQRASITDWFAIDDDDDGWPEQQRQRLVHTDPDLGLSDERVREELRSKLAALSAP